MGTAYAKIIDQLNRIEDWRELGIASESQWRETTEVVGLLQELDPAAADFLAEWPEEMLESVSSLVRASGRTGARLRWAWTPGYEFALTIAKTNFGADQAEYTISAVSPYPGVARASGG